MSPTSVVAYLVLFASAAFGVVLVALLLGRLVRPQSPSLEKLETYECGERTVGTSYVQFDLRFYVVALVFLIFDVEVAFFFPWATVFGKAAKLGSPPVVGAVDSGVGEAAAAGQGSAWVAEQMRQLGVPASQTRGSDWNAADAARIRESARKLALAAMADMAVFFLVLMVGFAYVWSRGDLNWVRAIPERVGIPGEASSDRVVRAAVREDAGTPVG